MSWRATRSKARIAFASLPSESSSRPSITPARTQALSAA
jgi:hypothetical protein